MLDFLKLILSRETRQTVGEILDRIRSSPEWKRELAIFDEQFRRDQQKETLVLIDHVAKLLATKAWDYEEIQTVRFVCLELIRNAFEHGLKDNRKGKVGVRVQVSGDFFQIDVTDPGSGFDLQKELERQQADDPRSKSCQALGFVYRLVSELSQDKVHNTVRAFLRKKHKPCKIDKVGDITVFMFHGETQPSGYFWAQIVRAIEELPAHSKIVLDFLGVDDISTRLLSEIFGLLKERGWLESLGPPSQPSAEDFLAIVAKEPRVVVCGIGSVNKALREFLRTHFLVFDNPERAIAYWEDTHNLG